MAKKPKSKAGKKQKKAKQKKGAAKKAVKKVANKAGKKARKSAGKGPARSDPSAAAGVVPRDLKDPLWGEVEPDSGRPAAQVVVDRSADLAGAGEGGPPGGDDARRDAWPWDYNEPRSDLLAAMEGSCGAPASDCLRVLAAGAGTHVCLDTPIGAEAASLLVPLSVREANGVRKKLRRHLMALSEEDTRLLALGQPGFETASPPPWEKAEGGADAVGDSPARDSLVGGFLAFMEWLEMKAGCLALEPKCVTVVPLSYAAFNRPSILLDGEGGVRRCAVSAGEATSEVTRRERFRRVREEACRAWSEIAGLLGLDEERNRSSPTWRFLHNPTRELAAEARSWAHTLCRRMAPRNG